MIRRRLGSPMGGGAPRRGRRIGRRLLILALSTIAALVLLELGARIFAALTDRERGLEFSPEVGWRMVPGVRKRGAEWCRSVPAEVNSRGFRDAETPIEKPFGKRRIVLLGDSFAFGQGVDYGERFSEVIEKDHPGIEVINLGVCAYATDQEVLVFEHEGRLHRPDVVILLAFPFNDLDALRYERLNSWPKPFFRLAGGELVLNRPHCDWITAIRTHSYVAEIVVQALERASDRSRVAPDASEDTQSLFISLVRRLAAGVAAVDAKLLVVIAHNKSSERKPRPDAVVRLCAGLDVAGIPFLDTFEAFSTRKDEVARLYLPDYHWTPEGHRLVAGVVLAELRRLGWVS